jgi:hypothetical protein
MINIVIRRNPSKYAPESPKKIFANGKLNKIKTPKSPRGKRLNWTKRISFAL